MISSKHMTHGSEGLRCHAAARTVKRFGTAMKKGGERPRFSPHRNDEYHCFRPHCLSSSTIAGTPVLHVARSVVVNDKFQRFIFALDVSTVKEAQRVVELLGDSIVFYKLGLQIWMAGGYYELIEWLIKRNKRVFVDLKFFDVPETVRSAVNQLKHRGVSFATVHGNDGILKAVVEEKNSVKILAVTVLTSLDQADIESLSYPPRNASSRFRQMAHGWQQFVSHPQRVLTLTPNSLAHSGRFFFI